MGKLIKLGAALPPAPEPPLSGPDWVQANPRWIATALERTQSRSGGGWYALDASRAIGREPRCFQIAPAGEPLGLVVYRGSSGEVFAGPNHCPHMGARLSDGRVEGDSVICPWHGLALGRKPRGSWQPLPTHDDGVLVWVQAGPEAETAPTDQPILAARPERFIDGVIRMEATCDPADVIANRLDPWHGAHFHPYAFGELKVLDIRDDEITVRVAKRVAGPVAIEVDARFHSPEPRTIAMTIVAGEGSGSVVETHATPIAAGRTAVIEASLASSPRSGFRWALRLSRLVRPFIERSARRLWVDDCAYAERLYEVRARQAPAAKRSGLRWLKR